MAVADANWGQIKAVITTALHLTPISVEQNSKDANLIQMANHILCTFQVCQYFESGKN